MRGRGYFDPDNVDAARRFSSAPRLAGRSIATSSSTLDRGAECGTAGIFNTYTVPTAKMRNGDFSEVLALNPAFRIYYSATGDLRWQEPLVLRERDHLESHQPDFEAHPGVLGKRVANTHVKEFTKKTSTTRWNHSGRCSMARPAGRP